MKALRIFAANIRDSFKSVFRNFSLSLASISCITITLIVVAIAVILTYNVNNFADLVKQDVTIVAFLKKGASKNDISEVETYIKNIPDVESYVFKSKEEIAEEMMEANETFRQILENLKEGEEHPLQDTFSVKANDIENIEPIANALKDNEKIETVKYGEGMVEQLIIVFKVVRNISVGVVVALIIVTAFLISNTIKITIFSRKKEIEIMRLVGASNMNIKIPFILEGLFLGIIGSIIPIIITTYGYEMLYSNFDGQLLSPFIKLIEPTPFIYYVSGVLLLIGMLVGMFGSSRAVRKFLKI